MRNETNSESNILTLNGMADIAEKHSKSSLDSYSGYGVGSAILVDYGPDWKYKPYVYAGFNINLSGMEVKIHAEQMALFQMLLDLETVKPEQKFPNLYSPEELNKDPSQAMMDNVSVEQLVVVTSDHDGAIRCGHCMQVTESVCEYIGQDTDTLDYVAAWRPDGESENFKFISKTLQERLGHTYITSSE